MTTLRCAAAHVLVCILAMAVLSRGDRPEANGCDPAIGCPLGFACLPDESGRLSCSSLAVERFKNHATANGAQFCDARMSSTVCPSNRVCDPSTWTCVEPRITCSGCAHDQECRKVYSFDAARGRLVSGQCVRSAPATFCAGGPEGGPCVSKGVDDDCGGACSRQHCFAHSCVSDSESLVNVTALRDLFATIPRSAFDFEGFVQQVADFDPAASADNVSVALALGGGKLLRFAPNKPLEGRLTLPANAALDARAAHEGKLEELALSGDDAKAVLICGNRTAASRVHVEFNQTLLVVVGDGQRFSFDDQLNLTSGARLQLAGGSLFSHVHLPKEGKTTTDGSGRIEFLGPIHVEADADGNVSSLGDADVELDDHVDVEADAHVRARGNLTGRGLLAKLALAPGAQLELGGARAQVALELAERARLMVNRTGAVLGELSLLAGAVLHIAGHARLPSSLNHSELEASAAERDVLVVSTLSKCELNATIVFAVHGSVHAPRYGLIVKFATNLTAQQLDTLHCGVTLVDDFGEQRVLPVRRGLAAQFAQPHALHLMADAPTTPAPDGAVFTASGVLIQTSGDSNATSLSGNFSTVAAAAGNETLLEFSSSSSTGDAISDLSSTREASVDLSSTALPPTTLDESLPTDDTPNHEPTASTDNVPDDNTNEAPSSTSDAPSYNENPSPAPASSSSDHSVAVTVSVVVVLLVLVGLAGVAIFYKRRGRAARSRKLGLRSKDEIAKRADLQLSSIQIASDGDTTTETKRTPRAGSAPVVQ